MWLEKGVWVCVCVGGKGLGVVQGGIGYATIKAKGESKKDKGGITS